MATKQVAETLGQFKDWKYFSLLEEKSENSDVDEKKEKEEEAKEGQEAVDKLRDNLSRFETAAGGKILKYKEFFDENQDMAGQFDEDGDVYKMWDSDYVAGVLTLPDEALSDEEIEEQMEEIDKEGGNTEEGDESEEEESEGEEEEEEGKEEKEEGEEEEEEAEEKEEEGEEEEEEGIEKEEEELEEGNAFSGALKKAKDKGKKNFKVGGKTYPVKESLEGEEFSLDKEEPTDINEIVIEKYRKLLLEKDEEDEGELPAEDVVTPEEESPEEEKETDEEGFTGFEVPGGEADLGDDDLGDLDGDGVNEPDEEEVEVEDGEAVEGDTIDGEGFAEEGGSSEYFVIYNMAGGSREEVFRTDDPKTIEEFKDFFENGYKGAIKAQIQAFKEAQEEKKREAERRAKEELRRERKEKLDKFMKESLDEDFDVDPYEEEYVLDRNGSPDYEEDESMMGNPNTDIEPNEDFYNEVEDFDLWEDELISLLVDEHGMSMEEAEELVANEDLEEAYEIDQDPEMDFSLEDFAAGLAEKYEG